MSRYTMERRAKHSASNTGRFDWTDEQIGEAMCAVAVNGRVTVLAYKRAHAERTAPMPSPAIILHRFDTWNAACERFGLEHGTARRTYTRMSDDALLDAIDTAAVVLGPNPAYAAYEDFARRFRLPSGTLVRVRLGGWIAALKRAEQRREASA